VSTEVVVRLVSVNVSSGRTVTWRGKEVHTGIFKEPVAGRILIHRTHVDGDRQADRTAHGGALKAVYAYSLTHYHWWNQTLDRELPFGMFGENLTIAGLDDESVGIGDHFQVGDAILEAAQPRLPCYKLGIRFDDASMTRRFFEAGRYGIYFRVIEEGGVQAGDAVNCVRRESVRVSVPALARMLDISTRDPVLARRALDIRALPPDWASMLRGDA
jgi:MOSC domain-containing protein YiiM